MCRYRNVRALNFDGIKEDKVQTAQMDASQVPALPHTARLIHADNAMGVLLLRTKAGRCVSTGNAKPIEVCMIS